MMERGQRSERRRSMKRFATLSILAVATALTISILTAGPAGCAGFSGPELKAFDQATTVYVATVRKDGNQSTPAPVWFTMSADRAQLLIQAHKGSWKDKRIRRGSPMQATSGGSNSTIICQDIVMTLVRPLRAVCGELLISPESAIHHTHSRDTFFGPGFRFRQDMDFQKPLIRETCVIRG